MDQSIHQAVDGIIQIVEAVGILVALCAIVGNRTKIAALETLLKDIQQVLDDIKNINGPSA